MKAVVLVGGEGTRLRPLTLTSPKQMLPIVEQPMLERVLAHLGRHGINEAVLSLGYLPDAFVRAYPDSLAAGVRLSYAVEPEPLDTAGAVRFAASAGGVDDTFVVVNGDVLTDLDVTALVALHRERGAEGTIALHPVPDPSAFGVVPTDADHRVTAFIEKPPADEAPTNLINAGTYVLEPSVLARIPSGVRVSIERATFPAMVADGTLFALADRGYWLDTGTPAAYLQAHFDLLEGRWNPPLGGSGGAAAGGEGDVAGSAPPVPGARRLDGGTWVLGAPEIVGKVSGACFLATAAVVAEGAEVERSVLGRGCRVAVGARVVDSVLLAGARVGAGAVVSGSILGPGSSVGEGCDVRPVSVLGAGAVVPPGAAVDGQRLPG